MTYAELTTLLQEYLENEETSFVANIDLFIKLAEEDVYRKVQLPTLRKNSTSLFTASDPYLAMPSDFLSPYSVAHISGGSHTFLTSKEVSFIREFAPAAATTGTPRYFAMFDQDTMIIAPTPSANDSVELHYYYKPASLTAGADDGTTWLSENAENALLFGALMQGYAYMKGDQDVITSYKEQYMKAIADLQVIAEGRIRKDSYRNIDKRQPV